MSHTCALSTLIPTKLSEKLLEATSKKGRIATELKVCEARSIECVHVAHASRAFQELQTATRVLVSAESVRFTVLNSVVQDLHTALIAAQTNLATDETLLRTRSQVKKAKDAESDFTNKAIDSIVAECDALKLESRKLDAVVEEIKAQITVAYNESMEAKTDTLKTESTTGTARCSNMSGHTVNNLLVVPGAMKGGAPTKKSAELWFQARFKATHREEFASFWASNKPRTIRIFATEEGVKGYNLLSNELGVTTPDELTEGGAAAEDSPKRSRKPTAAERKAQVWENTMGDVVAGPCVLCLDTEIHAPKRKGFEQAHIVSSLNKGEATSNNMIATCAGCNGVMAGQDMPTWISANIKDNDHRAGLFRLLASITGE
jgi:hypothetical protein